jgi:hypothetical protein
MVAQRLGLDEDEALSLGRVVAGRSRRSIVRQGYIPVEEGGG